jgi:hypothetical protein
MHEAGGVLQRRQCVHDGGLRVDVDLDELGGVLGEVARLGHDDDDGFADVADVAVGQHPAGRPAGVRAHHRHPERV